MGRKAPTAPVSGRGSLFDKRRVNRFTRAHTTHDKQEGIGVWPALMWVSGNTQQRTQLRAVREQPQQAQQTRRGDATLSSYPRPETP